MSGRLRHSCAYWLSTTIYITSPKFCQLSCNHRLIFPCSCTVPCLHPSWYGAQNQPNLQWWSHSLSKFPCRLYASHPAYQYAALKSAPKTINFFSSVYNINYICHSRHTTTIQRLLDTVKITQQNKWLSCVNHYTVQEYYHHDRWKLSSYTFYEKCPRHMEERRWNLKGFVKTNTNISFKQLIVLKCLINT